MGFYCCGRKINKVQTLVICISSFLVLFAFVFAAGWFNFTEGNLKNNLVYTGSFDPYALLDSSNGRDITKNGFNGVVLLAKITYIDIPNYRYLIHFDILPSGSLISDAAKTRVVAQSINIQFGNAVKSFPKSSLLFAQDIPYTISEGDTNKYPLDVYFDLFDLEANAVDPVTNNTIELPIAISVIGALQSWRFDFKIIETSPSAQQVQVTFKRSVTTRFFSFFIIIAMWLLSLSVFILALTLVLRDRKVEPPTIGITAALLFALPAIRNVQPGIPGIGCTADVIGLFWNLALVSLSSLMLFFNYIIKYRGDPRVKESSSASPLMVKEERDAAIA